MTATNHAMTGASIGLLIGVPIIALPVAFLSHFVCDAIPHFDKPDYMLADAWLKSEAFKRILIAEVIACFLIVVILSINRPTHWIVAALCAFLAASPDLFWINRYVKNKLGIKWHPSLFSKFASKIQWFAKPIGGVVELAWFSACTLIIYTLTVR